MKANALLALLVLAGCASPTLPEPEAEEPEQTEEESPRPTGTWTGYTEGGTEPFASATFDGDTVRVEWIGLTGEGDTGEVVVDGDTVSWHGDAHPRGTRFTGEWKGDEIVGYYGVGTMILIMTWRKDGDG